MNKVNAKETIWELIKYALIGTVNFLLDMVVVNILMYIFQIYKGYTLVFFNVISFFVYSTNGYFMNKKYTFKSNESSYPKYITVLAISMLLDSLMFSTLTLYNVFGLNKVLWANISKLIAFATTGTLCFIVNKFVVFKKE